MDVEQIDFSGELEYVGFWARAGAALVDSLLFLAVPLSLLLLFYGRDIFGLQLRFSDTTDIMIAVALPGKSVV